jgi:3-phenylpropionate/cinnamic acid dioxygenase small subunit
MRAAEGQSRLEDAHDLLVREAELLDAADYEGWLELFTDDAIYWLPEREGTDPRQTTSLLYDDRERLKDRVWRLRSGGAHAQIPPSRTVRLIGNERIVDEGDEIVVTSVLHIVEARGEVERVLGGRCEHRMRYVGGALKIARKTVLLANRSHFQHNLTLIV